jgi:hypothetical protein
MPPRTQSSGMRACSGRGHGCTVNVVNALMPARVNERAILLTSSASTLRSVKSGLAADRAWPRRRINSAPRWLATDLRESDYGRMSAGHKLKHKLKLFELLSGSGCKEIEVGCPAASEDHFGFVRQLISEDRVRPGAQVCVLMPPRADLITRTISSLDGASRSIVRLCNTDPPLPARPVSGADHDFRTRLATWLAALSTRGKRSTPGRTPARSRWNFPLPAADRTELSLAFEAMPDGRTSACRYFRATAQ